MEILEHAKKIKLFLEKYEIYSNDVTANFLLLDFEKCKFKAKVFYEKLKSSVNITSKLYSKYI